MIPNDSPSLESILQKLFPQNTGSSEPLIQSTEQGVKIASNRKEVVHVYFHIPRNKLTEFLHTHDLVNFEFFQDTFYGLSSSSDYYSERLDIGTGATSYRYAQDCSAFNTVEDLPRSNSIKLLTLNLFVAEKKDDIPGEVREKARHSRRRTFKFLRFTLVNYEPQKEEKFYVDICCYPLPDGRFCYYSLFTAEMVEATLPEFVAQFPLANSKLAQSKLLDGIFRRDSSSSGRLESLTAMGNESLSKEMFCGSLPSSLFKRNTDVHSLIVNFIPKPLQSSKELSTWRTDLSNLLSGALRWHACDDSSSEDDLDYSFK